MIRNTKRFLLVLSCALPAFFATSAFAAFDDVALDPKSGDTFIAERFDNPTGKVLLLNDFDAGFRREFELLDFPSPSTHVEVELSRADALTYLVQVDDIWIVGGLRKDPSGWRKLPVFSGLSGRGRASGLTSLPDGRMAMTVQSSKPGEEAQVVLFEGVAFAAAPASASSPVAATVSDGTAYRVIESIPVSRVEAEAERLAVASDAGKIDYDSGNGLGFAGGATSGVGIAYRRHFANKWGVQVAGIGFGDADMIFANLGVNVMRTLHKTKLLRFYAVAGTSVYYNGRTVWTAPPPAPCGVEPCDPMPKPEHGDGSSEWQNDFTLNFGAGIGMEFRIAGNLGLSLELPIDVMLGVGKDGVRFKGIYPIPNASLIYYF